jgi:cytochrome c-type biogenesis protein CcmE
MTPRRRRLMFVLAALLCAGTAMGLVLNAFRSNLVFFFSPTQVAAKEAPLARSFRLGGLVQQGSVRREGDGMTVRFVVTDTAQSVPVVYRGLLPDLFREGKGVVTRGKLQDDGVFQAAEVLAKHDENYMPPEAADALEKAGHPMGSRAAAPATASDPR